MGGIVMAWVKYNNDGLVNLDKITDINIVKVQDEEGNYIYDIRFYNGENYSFKRYTSLEECMHAFEHLTKWLSLGVRFIDITSVS